MNIATKIYTKLRLNWGYAYNDIRSFMGVNDQQFKKMRGARILVYHGVCRTDHTRFNSIFLRVKTFESHLKFFKKYFNVVSLDELYNGSLSDDHFNICITFDDGFANNHKYVLPLIHQYDVPAAFFITGIRQLGRDILWNDYLAIAQKYGPHQFEFIDDVFHKNKYGQYISRYNGRYLKELLRERGIDDKDELIRCLDPLVNFRSKINDTEYWLQLTEVEIKQLSSSPLVTIGCHGYYHNDLSKIPITDAAEEMKRSKLFLENITGKQINAIAFPYGAYTGEVVREAKSCGFTKLLAADFLFPEDHSDRSMRQRFTVNPYLSVNNQMTAIINGKYKT
jgi:peptidoglycan/xylan/chitin deacetylase (PgdA/CDA1 family)